MGKLMRGRWNGGEGGLWVLQKLWESQRQRCPTSFPGTGLGDTGSPHEGEAAGKPQTDLEKLRSLGLTLRAQRGPVPGAAWSCYRVRPDLGGHSEGHKVYGACCLRTNQNTGGSHQ